MKTIYYAFAVLALALFTGCSSGGSADSGQASVSRDGASTSTGSGGAAAGGGSATR